MKKKLKNTDEIIIDTSKKDKNGSDINLEKGVYNLKDYIAPTSVDRSNIDYLVVGKQYVRNFVMQGFPNQVWVGWLDTIYNSDSDIDTTIHIEPADDRQALDALTAKITQFEAQLATETEKGNIRNVTRLGDAIQGLYEERRKLERNTEKLYQIQVTCNLYCDSKDQLDKERKMYEQNEKDQELVKLQRQLAILQRSGGSASQIRSLQDQISNKQRDTYFDNQEKQIFQFFRL